MKQFIHILFFIVNCQLLPGIGINCFCQAFDKTFHDFGIITEGSNRVADFILSNSSNEIVYILTSEYDPDINLKYSTQKIFPDSLAIVRIKYNPTRKGTFNKKIRLYISSSPDPIDLNIRGKIYFIDKNDDPECPDFDKPASNTTDFTLDVFKMHDSIQVINAVIKIFEGNVLVKTIFSNSEGKAEQALRTGHVYHLIVESDGFYSEELTMLVNKITNTATFYLEPVSQLEEEELSILIANDTDITTTIATIPVPAIATLITNPGNEFPENKFAPNNIVFLIDVSFSMGDSRKLDLLKVSMVEMIEILRNIDRVAVITFATNTKIVIPSHPVSEKEKIIEIINNLKAGGATAGGKSIRKAYEVADDNYIDGGNNQVILATDGIFNADRDLLNDIKNMANSGITISVIGIKADKDVARSLENISQQGDGNYINIDTFGKARRVLVAEIKRNSFIIN